MVHCRISTRASFYTRSFSSYVLRNVPGAPAKHAKHRRTSWTERLRHTSYQASRKTFHAHIAVAIRWRRQVTQRHAPQEKCRKRPSKLTRSRLASLPLATNTRTCQPNRLLATTSRDGGCMPYPQLELPKKLWNRQKADSSTPYRLCITIFLTNLEVQLSRRH